MFKFKNRSDKDVALSQKETIELYQAVFFSEVGKRVLRHMMKKYGVLRTTVHESSHLMYFQEGQRAVVLEIIKNLKMDTKQLQQMIDEGDFDE